jgi:HlyD family secretion protein
MAITRTQWVGVLLGAVIVVLVLLGVTGRNHAPEVQLAKVVRQNLDASITSNGKVEPIQPYVVRAQFPTFVARISAVEGQSIRRGQPILTLDAQDARVQLAQARENLIAAQEDLRAARAGGPAVQMAELEGNLKKAQADVASLQSTQEALKKLVAQKAATQDELNQNQLSLARAQAELQTLQQKKQDMSRTASVDVQRATLRAQQASELIKALEAKVASATVKSPVDGTLYSLPVHVGDYVKVGDELADMADLRRVRVRAYVDEPDLGSLAAGQAVEITWDAMPAKLWAGVTEQVPKQVVPHGTRSVGEVLCSVDNSKLELLPNINMNVRIRVRSQANALVVPRSTVRSEGTRHFVYVLDGDHLRQREITVGIASATMYEVTSGLKEGDRLALPGEVELKDGMEVRGIDVP